MHVSYTAGQLFREEGQKVNGSQPFEVATLRLWLGSDALMPFLSGAVLQCPPVHRLLVVLRRQQISKFKFNLL